ncbi:MAG TPA: RNA 2',3'-cyclic phosphodiesterase [Polyangiales bacterium]|nr:RNA 2',3'-cyclic phosphodiesterase [Polyangiales bacterium]
MPERAPATSRLFIAASPAGVTQEAFAAALEPLRDGPNLRWLSPEKRHFTLRFLGQVPDSQRSAISQACAATAAESPAFDLVLAGAGAFPRKSRATVLWIGVSQGEAELVRLAAGLDAGLVALGFQPEGRPFVPHLTVARSRQPQQLTAAVDALASLRLSGCVRSIELIRSHLGGRESSYETLGSFVLQRVS